MPKLDDGTVIPSYLNVTSSSEQKMGYAHSVSDTSLRIGRVLAAYEVSSDGNRNKKTLEYDVSVRHSDGASGWTDIVYPRVRLSNLFGGATDFFRWTPRIDNFDDTNQIGNGSRVLLLCINGNQRLAYIIGGVPHPEDATTELPFENNHHMEFQFNGIYANVDKDGTFTMIHRGATNANNSLIDKTGTGSSIRFNKDGDIELSYKYLPPNEGNEIATNSNDLPFITLFKQDETIETYAPKDIFNHTASRYLIQTTNGVKVNHNGADQQAWLRATAYREKQIELHSKLITQLYSLFNLLTSAGTSLSAIASEFGVISPLMVIPVVGPTIAAPAFVSIAITTAAESSTILAAAQVAAQMSQAISDFEQSTDIFLSPTHTHADHP